MVELRMPMSREAQDALESRGRHRLRMPASREAGVDSGCPRVENQASGSAGDASESRSQRRAQDALESRSRSRGQDALESRSRRRARAAHVAPRVRTVEKHSCIRPSRASRSGRPTSRELDEKQASNSGCQRVEMASRSGCLRV